MFTQQAVKGLVSPSPVWSKVRYRPLVREIFASFIRLALRRYFSGFNLLGPIPSVDPDRPWIFLANHISWWDGFFLWSLQRKLAPERRIYTVMLAREFRKVLWFRWIGALPLEPGSPASLRQLLRYSTSLTREQKPFILSFFPQGEIRPQATRPLQLRRGWQALRQAIPDALVIPVALHIEPGTAPSPKVWVSLGDPLPSHPAEEDLRHSLTRAQDAITDFLNLPEPDQENASVRYSLF